MKQYFLAPLKPKTLEVLVYKLQAIAHPYLYNKALRSYIYIYMLGIAGQTARP